MALPASLYANIPQRGPQLVPAPATKPIAHERKAAAAPERERELRVKQKIDQADRVLDRLEARSAQLAAEINRLQARKAHTTGRRDRVESRILSEMTAAGLERAAGNSARWTAKPNAQSLVVDDESLIPAEYLRETLASAADKIAIKAALARDPDLTIAGCHLEQSVSLVRK
jgi:hypothetical protein